MNMNYKDRFIAEVRRNSEDNTCLGYERDIRLFLEAMAAEKKIYDEVKLVSSITNDDIEDWFDMHTNPAGEHYTLTTINRKIISLSLFFEYMKTNKGLIKKNPFDGVSLYKNATSEEKIFLTLDEVRTVIEETYIKHKGDRCFEFNSAKIRFIMALMCTTGLRISEVVDIDMNDIEEVGEDYIIKKHKDRVKNNIDKRVPICGVVKKYYHEYLAERRMLGLNPSITRLIINNKGKNVTRDATAIAIKKYVGHTGINKEISNHSFRHTFRTTLTKMNVNESLICMIGGWSRKGLSLSSTYTHDDEDLDIEKIKICNFL